MSDNKIEEEQGGRSRRSETLQSQVDPLDSSHPTKFVSNNLEAVKSEDSGLQPEYSMNQHHHQGGNITSQGPKEANGGDESQSQYTLDTDSVNSKQVTNNNSTNNDNNSNNNNKSNNPIALTKDTPSDMGPIRRRSSIAAAKEAVVEFNKRKPILMVLSVYFKIFVVFLAVLSIYWGSFYKRFDRYSKMKFLVLNEDSEIDGIPAYLGKTVNETLASASYYGDWKIFDAARFQKVADEHNNTLEQEFYRQIHHQNYWGGFRIKPNATFDLYEAMIKVNTTFVNQSMIDCVYESSRSLLGMTAYVEPNLKIVQNEILKASSEGVFQKLISGHLTSAQRHNLLVKASQIITSKSYINTIDYRPVTSAAAVGPSLMGLVYCLVLSLHQFNFAARIHAKLVVKLKTKDFIIFRLLSSQATFLLLSFLYCLMTLAFQIPVTTTFGKSGFLVLWSTIFLYFAAIGGINENAATYISSRNRVYIGFWVVFLIVINVSTTFYPLALCPKFYRYGYALPVPAAHEIMNVIFFNTWKGNLARSYGILIIWAVITNIALPYTMKNAQQHIAKVAAKNAAKKK